MWKSLCPDLWASCWPPEARVRWVRRERRRAASREETRKIREAWMAKMRAGPE